MSTRTPLPTLRIANPCPADWDEMTGDYTRRFCQHCQKHVHNLSAMPPVEAERLVCQSARSLCVRYAADADGHPVPLNYLRQTPPRFRWRLWSAIAILIALVTGTVEAFFYGKRVVVTAPLPPAPQPVRMLMGDVAPVSPCPTPTPATPTAH